jgi:hypothetical protein
MKVFQIGFNKCGTSPIWKRLDALGFSATHLKTHDERNLALTLQANLQTGQPILTGLEDYDAFTDIEAQREDRFVEGYKFYPQILEQVPDAWFILNLRDRERWVKSRLDHNGGRYDAALLRLLGVSTLEALADQWRQDWDDHIEKVQAAIPAERLLVHNIETDDPTDIDRFLNRGLVKPLSTVPQNFTRSRLSKTLSRLVPSAIKRSLPKELNRSLHYFLRKRH